MNRTLAVGLSIVALSAGVIIGLPEKQAPDSKLLVCKQARTGKIRTIKSINKDDQGPADYTCMTAVAVFGDYKSRGGRRTHREASLQTQCGFEITPLSWGCCPYCLQWESGCPPCVAMCKYGNEWPTHRNNCSG